MKFVLGLIALVLIGLALYVYTDKDNKQPVKQTVHKTVKEVTPSREVVTSVEKKVSVAESRSNSEVKLKTEDKRVKKNIILPKSKAQMNYDESYKDLSYEDIRQDSSLSDAEKKQLIEQKIYFDNQNKFSNHSSVQKYTAEETEEFLKNNLLLHSTN